MPPTPDPRSVLDGLDFIPRLLCDTCDEPAVASIVVRCPRCREPDSHIVCRYCEPVVLGMFGRFWRRDSLGCTNCRYHFHHTPGASFSDVLTWDRIR